MKRHRKRDRVSGHVDVVAEPTPKTPEEIVADTRDQIWSVLYKLEEISTAVRDLRDTHQATSGYVTGEDKRAQGQAHARDTLAHALRLKDGQPVGPGESPSPGNLAAISADAQIWFALRHQIRVLTKHAAKTGTPRIPTPPGETASIGDVVWHLNLVIGLVDDTKLLNAALKDLTQAHQGAVRLVDGSDDRLMDKPCPWCGSRSLRLDQAGGVITCDRDPRKALKCICDDAFCACKQNPAQHKHTWRRDRGSRPGSWWALIDQQNRAEREHNRRNQETTP